MMVGRKQWYLSENLSIFGLPWPAADFFIMDLKMDINELKEKLSEIENIKSAIEKRFEAELSNLKDLEREFVEDYLSNNAKYQTNEKVLKKENFSKNWDPCFIGWRDINRKTWTIEYYTHHIKKDGSPGKIMSSYPCSEDCIKPYK
jgi:hypothetical protein